MTYELALQQVYGRLLRYGLIACDYLLFKMVTVAPLHCNGEAPLRSDFVECVATGLESLGVGMYPTPSLEFTDEPVDQQAFPHDELWQQSLYTPCEQSTHDSCLGTCYYSLPAGCQSSRMRRYSWLMNWSGYACAFPDRVEASLKDVANRTEAALWLQSLALVRRDRANNAIRTAADFLAEGDTVQCTQWLYNAACLQLPAKSGAQRSLLDSLEQTPRDQVVHELIYLARSAPRDIRALACARLQLFTFSTNAKRTLAQLRWDSSARVRAAASLNRPSISTNC